MTDVVDGLRLGFDFLCHCEEQNGAANRPPRCHCEGRQARGNPYLVQAVIFRNDIVV